LTPDQEERQVKAWEAIAEALTKIANPLMSVGPTGLVTPATPLQPVTVDGAVDMLGVAGKFTVTGDTASTGMKAV
jgi:hypothetical protein